MYFYETHCFKNVNIPIHCILMIISLAGLYRYVLYRPPRCLGICKHRYILEYVGIEILSLVGNEHTIVTSYPIVDYYNSYICEYV